MEDDEILKYSMQIAMLKQLLNKKLIDEKEYEKIKKELMKENGSKNYTRKQISFRSFS